MDTILVESFESNTHHNFSGGSIKYIIIDTDDMMIKPPPRQKNQTKTQCTLASSGCLISVRAHNSVRCLYC